MGEGRDMDGSSAAHAGTGAKYNTSAGGRIHLAAAPSGREITRQSLRSPHPAQPRPITAPEGGGLYLTLRRDS